MSCSLLVRMFCDCSQIVVVLGLAIRLWLLYGSKCCSDAFVKLQSVFIASNHANAAHNRFSLYILYTIHFAIKCTHHLDTQTSSENQKHASAHKHTYIHAQWRMYVCEPWSSLLLLAYSSKRNKYIQSSDMWTDIVCACVVSFDNNTNNANNKLADSSYFSLVHSSRFSSYVRFSFIFPSDMHAFSRVFFYSLRSVSMWSIARSHFTIIPEEFLNISNFDPSRYRV